MRNKTVFTIIVALSLSLTLALGGAALAWHGPSRDDRGRGSRYYDGPRGDGRFGDGSCGGIFGDGPQAFGPYALEMLRDLDLTRDQRERVRDLLENHRQELRKTWDNLRDLRHDLSRESMAAKPNEGKIRELSRNLGEAVAEAALLGSRIADELKGVLTPEQRERLAEARRGLEKWGPGRHRGWGGCR